MSPSRDRALSPVLGVVLLVAVAVALAAVVGGAVLAGADPAAPPPSVHLDCRVDVAVDRVACVHGGGDALDVRDLQVRLSVNGEPLAHQPPVPFFAARGFHAGPTGPFNSAADPRWTAGETAGVSLASTNRPGLTPGAQVEIRIATDSYTVARVEIIASA
ncbi:MAG: type IV pilin [Haloglomus sp.]